MQPKRKNVFALFYFNIALNLTFNFILVKCKPSPVASVQDVLYVICSTHIHVKFCLHGAETGQLYELSRVRGKQTIKHPFPPKQKQVCIECLLYKRDKLASCSDRVPESNIPQFEFPTLAQEIKSSKPWVLELNVYFLFFLKKQSALLLFIR